MEHDQDLLDEGEKVSGISHEFQGDVSDPHAFGRYFVDSVFRILKVASIYSTEHNQTRQAIEEFMPSFQESVRAMEGGAISLTIRGELCNVNGETLRLRRREQERLNELYEIFYAAHIRGLVFEQGLTSDGLMSFLAALNQAARDKGGMEHVEVPYIEIQHGSPDQTIVEAVAAVNKAVYVAHLYIRALVKVKNMHEQVRELGTPDLPTGVVRRVLQTISELLADDDFTILGLLTMRLVSPDISSHSVNTAVYSMLLADRLGLDTQAVSQVGMAVIYQDLDRLVGVAVGHRDREAGLDAHRQLSANLRDIAMMLEYVGGDVVSTQRIILTYERGSSGGEVVGRPFYRAERRLHLLSRIVDLARTYDLLIQGLQGYKSRQPDLAIQYVESRAEEVFDPHLVALMVSSLGLYPIGTTVQLTSGEHCVVIRTPSPSADPRRPVVRLLDRRNPAVLDLSDERYAHIEIARSVEMEETGTNVSQIFLLT